MSKAFDSSNFDQEVIQSSSLVLVDMWAEWCGPCQVLGPIIEEVAQEVGDSAVVGKLNVDDSSDIAQKYGVMSIPTVILFKNGEPVEQIVGVRQKQDYIDLIQQHS